MKLLHFGINYTICIIALNCNFMDNGKEIHLNTFREICDAREELIWFVFTSSTEKSPFNRSALNVSINQILVFIRVKLNHLILYDLQNEIVITVKTRREE